MTPSFSVDMMQRVAGGQMGGPINQAKVRAAMQIMLRSPQIALSDVSKYADNGLVGVGIGAGGPLLLGLAAGGQALAGGGGAAAAASAGAGAALSAAATTALSGKRGAGPQGEAAMTMTQPGYGYGIAGPGVPEPADGTWTTRWTTHAYSKTAGTFQVFFWQMVDGYTLCYNPRTRGWKRYKIRKNIVLSSDPRVSNIGRAVRATEGKLKRLAKKTKRLQYKS